MFSQNSDDSNDIKNISNLRLNRNANLQFSDNTTSYQLVAVPQQSNYIPHQNLPQQEQIIQKNEPVMTMLIEPQSALTSPGFSYNYESSNSSSQLHPKMYRLINYPNSEIHQQQFQNNATTSSQLLPEQQSPPRKRMMVQSTKHHQNNTESPQLLLSEQGKLLRRKVHHFFKIKFFINKFLILLRLIKTLFIW